jgi:hypothetical protein
MADENDNGSPSADEIVDNMAADMGVEDEQVPEESGDDAIEGLGGIFDVPASKKRKKKKSKKKTSEGSDDDEKPSKKERLKANIEKEKAKEEAAARKEAAKQELDSLGGVIDPSADDVDIDDLDVGGDYLGETDLDGHKGGASTSTIIMGLIIVVLLGALGAVVFTFTDIGDDVVALFQGELRERRIAEADREKREWEEEQAAKLEKYGTLNIMGSPPHALIKLNGQVQYGQTSSEEWRELRLVNTGTLFRNLRVKEKHTVEVSAPNHKPEKMEITEGMWDGDPDNPFGYSRNVTVNLIPESGQKQLEFEQRMDTSDTEGEYFGEVTINTIPSGAKVIFNNHPLLDEDGEELVTPVSFSKFYVEDEDSGKLEERDVNVDTPPDRGHKIVLQVPEEEGEFPEYITQLNRRMWTCDWEDGQAPDTPAAGKKFRDYCEYNYTVDLDFNSLKSYIERREAERERVRERNAKLKAEAAELEEQQAEE